MLRDVSLLTILGYLEVALCGAAVTALLLRRQWANYRWLGVFLLVRGGSDITLTTLHSAYKLHVLTGRVAYNSVFYLYWISLALESVLALLLVYGIYRLAMAPLKGLQTLGMLIFKWAAGISFIVAFSSAFLEPSGVAGRRASANELLMSAISQLHRTQSVLTLCLLIFVFFAIRPMGLSFRSRIFGVSAGLAVMAVSEIAEAAYMTLNPSHMSAVSGLLNGISICVVLAIWTAYFALPEPKRKMIVLPTTSPFLRWNQISQALGDDPGVVAVGGIPPEMLASAEIEVMKRASAKMPGPASVTEFPVATLSEERLSASRAI